MLLRMLYDDKLAQAAYLIGCQRTGEAIIFDPERDVDRYLDAARREGLRITAVAETHIHADFLSGARQLAHSTGAKVYLSGEGGPDWQYTWPAAAKGAGGNGRACDHRILRHGDTFSVGNIEFRAIHTPGHTPEHLCYTVTDRGGGATEPMGIITGDFVFVGDLGRPDLLETAAGQAGAKEPSAKALYASLRQFLELPDYLQIWPAHGAGSACGKALGAVPQTTVGYERRFNPAIRAAGSEAGFINFILEGQPEPPLYFARMKRLNKIGPPVLGGLPRPRQLSAEQALALAGRAGNDGPGPVIIDTRPWEEFRKGHLPGSLFIPLDNSFNTIAGSFIHEDEPIALVLPAARVDEAVRDLVRIGLDRIEGFIDPSAIGDARLESTPEITASQAAAQLSGPEQPFILDVRRAAEYHEGHIPGAMNIAHTRLAAHLDQLPRNQPILVHCRSGVRSSRSAALLQRHGFDVTNLAGGYLAWEQAGVTRASGPGPDA